MLIAAPVPEHWALRFLSCEVLFLDINAFTRAGRVPALCVIRNSTIGLNLKASSSDQLENGPVPTKCYTRPRRLGSVFINSWCSL